MKILTSTQMPPASANQKPLSSNRGSAKLMAGLLFGLALHTTGANAAYSIRYTPPAIIAPPSIILTPTPSPQSILAHVPSNSYQRYVFQAYSGNTHFFTINDPSASTFAAVVTVYDPAGSRIISQSACCGQRLPIQFQASQDGQYQLTISSYGTGGSTYLSYGYTPLVIVPSSNTQMAYVQVPQYGAQTFYFQGYAGIHYSFFVNDPVGIAFPVQIMIFGPAGNLISNQRTCCGAKLEARCLAPQDGWYKVIVSNYTYSAGGSTSMTYRMSSMW